MLVYVHEAWTDVSVAGIYDRGANRKLNFALGANRDDSLALNNHRAMR